MSQTQETEWKTLKQIETKSRTRVRSCAQPQKHTHRHTDRRPWSILWPVGDLTAQQLLAVWCFTLRITFHFQTLQPIGERQKGRDRGRLFILFLPFDIAPQTRHYQEHPRNMSILTSVSVLCLNTHIHVFAFHITILLRGFNWEASL